MRWIVMLWLILPGAAVAQEDPMELQRCIWRCLSGSPGAGSAQYNQCVEQFCIASAPTAPPASWAWGPTPDGRFFFAGVSETGGDKGLYYICTRSGDSFFSLTGLEGPDAQMRFILNNVQYLVPFAWVGGDFRIDQAAGSDFMNAIASAAQVQVQNSGGVEVMSFSLQGAGAAMQQAVNACFG